jgi:site-specific DNA-methyltransferase (adenine-specific)
MTNHLYYGDNLKVLRDSIANDSVDLIYLDPPFNSNASYNVLFKGPQGNASTAQIEAFDDTWHWTDAAEEAFGDVLRSGNGNAAEMLRAMRSFLGENDMMAYLAMMAVRLLELQRVLKPTGSLYLHCDPTASHYLKILLDAVFGARNFKNEIVWKRRYGNFSRVHEAKKYGASNDIILFYNRSEESKFKTQYSFDNPEYQDYVKRTFRHKYKYGRIYRIADLANPAPRPNLMYEYKGYKPPKNGWAISLEKMKQWDAEGRLEFPKKADGRIQRRRFLDELKGKPIQSLWDDVEMLSSQSAERLGYPTQKPVALLERIIAASSNEGDIVLDPFCDCGTTVHAAQKLNRQWIGIDITHLAIGLIEKRLRDAFQNVQFTTHGVPQDLSGARDMAARGREDKNYYFEFEKWALSLLNAQPGNLSKKGADRGIDGNLYFAKTSRAIVSVKAGDNVGVSMIRDLRGVIEREKAEIGVFLTLNEPTKPMITEAAAAGQHVEDGFAPVPKIQIVTIEQALQLRDRAVQIPARRDDTFKKAAREKEPGQGSLDL